MSMSNTKYTFLLPAYKAMFFAKALKSIKHQTFKNFKCLVSDDCSPEDLKSIFDEIVGDDSRFCYSRNVENIGTKSLVSHWNLLVDMCETEYLIMASDDDVYEPIFLEEIDILTNKYPNVDLFRGRVRKINKDDKLIEKDILLDEYQNQIEFLHSFFCLSIIKCVSHYVFRKSKLLKINRFFDLPLACCSDNATAILMSDNGVCNTPSIVFSFRNSGINITDNNSASNRIEKTKAHYLYINFLENIIPNLQIASGNLYEEKLYKKISLFLYSNHYTFDIYMTALRSSFKEMIKYYKCLCHFNCLPGFFDKFRFFVRWILMFKFRQQGYY